MKTQQANRIRRQAPYRPRAKKRYGQHFLEASWADRLIEAIDPQPEDDFLEIGPGEGALTRRLGPRVHHVTAVEVDAELVAALAPRLPANVALVQEDFLRFDTAKLPAAGKLRVAGNLPYNISSPVLFKLLRLHREQGTLVDATLMLQREVAERIQAGPGSRDYGVMSIFVQLHADVRTLLTLPPGAFRPSPKVHSAVIALRFREPAVTVSDRATFDAMVRAMFMERRKQLTNALRRFADASGVPADEALARAGIDGARRPETLQLAELARLADAFGAGADRAVL